eukprot:1211374-Prymnesium_polylepis.1
MSIIAVSAEPNMAVMTVSMLSGKPRGPDPNTAARSRSGCAAVSPPRASLRQHAYSCIRTTPGVLRVCIGCAPGALGQCAPRHRGCAPGVRRVCVCVGRNGAGPGGAEAVSNKRTCHLGRAVTRGSVGAEAPAGGGGGRP